MNGLTPSRLNRAKPNLDRYRDLLLKTGKLNFPAFEKELKEAWKVGYQELKSMIIDLVKRQEYTPLAVRYMEEGEPGVAAEFKRHLAKIYDVKSYHAKDREEKQKQYWDRVLTGQDMDDSSGER